MIVLDPLKPIGSFPCVDAARPDGLLAIGGDLSAQRLLDAYRHGIFPWYNEGQPILWWSPDPRALLYPDRLHVSRSLRKTLRRGDLTVTADTCFRAVMLACAESRPQYPQGGTWITAAMIDAYTDLHRLGYAHSVEVWRTQTLVGGLYGVALGGAFFGESMFSRARCIQNRAGASGAATACVELPLHRLPAPLATLVPARRRTNSTAQVSRPARGGADARGSDRRMGTCGDLTTRPISSNRRISACNRAETD